MEVLLAAMPCLGLAPQPRGSSRPSRNFPAPATASTLSKMAPNSFRCKSNSQHQSAKDEDEDIHGMWLFQVSPAVDEARHPCDFHSNPKEGTIKEPYQMIKTNSSELQMTSRFSNGEWSVSCEGNVGWRYFLQLCLAWD